MDWFDILKGAEEDAEKFYDRTMQNVFLYADTAIEETRESLDRLNELEKEAEEYIKKGSISEVRVRCHGSTARIEIPKNELQIFCKEYDFNELVNYFSNLGFNCTSLDLEGLISGKLNR